MTEERLKELERLAGACLEIYMWDWPKQEMLTIPPFYRDRVFMAAASPTAVLELIAEIRRLRKEN